MSKMNFVSEGICAFDVKQILFLYYLGLVPVSEDKEGYLKFKVLSWKTVMTYLVFGILPTISQVYFQISNEQTSGQQIDLMTKIAGYLTGIQSIVVSLLCPVLTAHLLDKSQVSLSRKKLAKTHWLLLYVLMFAVSTAINVCNSFTSYKNIALPILILTSYSLNVIIIIVNMLVISYVCSPIIEEGTNIEISDVHEMIKRSVTQVEKSRRIKQGFRPLLFTILSFTTIYIIYITYVGIRSVAKGEHHYLVPDVLSVLAMLLLLYYIISFCDESHQTLSSFSHNLRYIL